MENPIKMDDFGGTTIFGNIHVKNKISKKNKRKFLILFVDQGYGIFQKSIGSWNCLTLVYSDTSFKVALVAILVL